MGSQGKIADFHSKTAHYVPIKQQEIPEKIRFDTPRMNQGQMVEVSYGGFSRYEHSKGDPYMRVVDHSGGVSEYYVWVEKKREKKRK